jgi:hypothetical protein
LSRLIYKQWLKGAEIKIYWKDLVEIDKIIFFFACLLITHAGSCRWNALLLIVISNDHYRFWSESQSQKQLWVWCHGETCGVRPINTQLIALFNFAAISSLSTAVLLCREGKARQQQQEDTSCCYLLHIWILPISVKGYN